MHITGCPGGKKLRTGGYELVSYDPASKTCFQITGSYPSNNKWNVGYANKGTRCKPVTVRIYAICE